MSTKKKIATIVITTVALTAGTVGISTAATKSSIARVTTSRVLGGANDMTKGHGAEIAGILAGLVTKGTITQAQADAITAALVAAKTAEHPNGPKDGTEGKGHRGKGGPMGAPTLTLPATPKA